MEGTNEDRYRVLRKYRMHSKLSAIFYNPNYHRLFDRNSPFMRTPMVQMDTRRVHEEERQLSPTQGGRKLVGET